MKKQILTFLFMIALLTISMAQEKKSSCYDDYTYRFETIGGNPVPDGMQNVVVAVIYSYGGANCVMGKLMVKDGKGVPPLMLVGENDDLVKPNDTLSRMFYRQAHDESNLFSIDNAMSAIFVTERNNKARLFFIDYLKADPGAIVKAPSLNSASVEKVKMQSKSIQFNSGKATLTQSSYGPLNEIAEVMKSNATVNWIISGYTDNSGNENANLILSTKRAESVKKYLIGKGVDAEKMKAIGYGVANPVANNSTPEGRATNRRVEIVPVQ